jgi:hypothetical protein
MEPTSKPMFAAIEYVPLSEGLKKYHRSGKRKGPQLRSLGILRQDGTYTAINAYDYASWIVGTNPRKCFPVGVTTNKEIIEVLAKRLSDLFAEDKYPPVPAMRQLYRAVYREALDDLGFNRKRTNGVWFGEPAQER